MFVPVIKIQPRKRYKERGGGWVGKWKMDRIEGDCLL